MTSGVHIFQRLSDHRVEMGRRLIYANILANPSRTAMIAVDYDGKGSMWFGQLLLCYSAKYLAKRQQLCYIRWLGTAKAVAEAAGRELTDDESRGPFEAYRWNLHPGGGRFTGHPLIGSAHYGIVDVSRVMFVAPMIPALLNSINDEDPLFRLNIDMWEKF